MNRSRSISVLLLMFLAGFVLGGVFVTPSFLLLVTKRQVRVFDPDLWISNIPGVVLGLILVSALMFIRIRGRKEEWAGTLWFVCMWVIGFDICQRLDLGGPTLPPAALLVTYLMAFFFLRIALKRSGLKEREAKHPTGDGGRRNGDAAS